MCVRISRGVSGGAAVGICGLEGSHQGVRGLWVWIWGWGGTGVGHTRGLGMLGAAGPGGVCSGVGCARLCPPSEAEGGAGGGARCPGVAECPGVARRRRGAPGAAAPSRPPGADARRDRRCRFAADSGRVKYLN